MTVQKDAAGSEKKFLRQFADFQDQRVLEVGCGEGRLTRHYAHASSLTIGLDSDPDALRVALIESPHESKHKSAFINAQAEHLPFSKNKFDIAILAWSL
ncbi:MAG: hypothetical protein DCC56_15695 [Anaerolineae bacterium]|nr:MAG: hypothetical protein DCC56_15695 [Anaerolineae bacterium]WKZ42971.1 MAG: class I SAM-dependent methyltransferase [Anaerolineales bacterium]